MQLERQNRLVYGAVKTRLSLIELRIHLHLMNRNATARQTN